MNNKMVVGLFQVGVLVNDIDECLRLFRDTLGMDVILEARDCILPAKELSGVERQMINVLILHGEDGVDLEIHQYVDPLAKQHQPLNHSDIGSMHFMLRVHDIFAVAEKIKALGYSFMSPITESKSIPDFKFTYFRGPDGMMIELHEGLCEIK